MTRPVGPLRFTRATCTFTPADGEAQEPFTAAAYLPVPGTGPSRLVLLSGTEVHLDVLDRQVAGSGHSYRVTTLEGTWLIVRQGGGCSACGGR